MLSIYRRKYIASNLCEFAQRELTYLYAEVDITNSFIRILLEKLNFKRVDDKLNIIRLLDKQRDKLLFLDDDNDLISYKHINHKYELDQIKTFVMYDYKI